MTQQELLLAHLRGFNHDKNEYRTISQMEALGLYRIRSLSSRISELQAKGYEIKKTRKIDPTGVPYVRYALCFRAFGKKRQ